MGSNIVILISIQSVDFSLIEVSTFRCNCVSSVIIFYFFHVIQFIEDSDMTLKPITDESNFILFTVTFFSSFFPIHGYSTVIPKNSMKENSI